jgi:hypothetical protein
MPPRGGAADGGFFNFVNDLTVPVAVVSAPARCLLSTQRASRLCNAQIRRDFYSLPDEPLSLLIFRLARVEASATLACLVAGLHMAYEFDLQEIEGPIEEADGSKIVEFILGFDADLDTIVVMSVMMVPTDRTDTLELCFGIRTKDYGRIILDGAISPPDYSREGSQKYIPTEYKLEILPRICRGGITLSGSHNAELHYDGDVLRRSSSKSS